MNFNLSARDITDVLNKVNKPDFSIPENKRQSILNNPSLKFHIDSIAKTAAKHRGTLIPSIPYSLFKLYYENGNRNEFQFSEKGGYNNKPHNHNDADSFRIFKNGETKFTAEIRIYPI